MNIMSVNWFLNGLNSKVVWLFVHSQNHTAYVKTNAVSEILQQKYIHSILDRLVETI